MIPALYICWPQPGVWELRAILLNRRRSCGYNLVGSGDKLGILYRNRVSVVKKRRKSIARALSPGSEH